VLDSAIARPPEWLTEVAVCPVDRGILRPDGDRFSCLECGRAFPVTDDGIVSLLPDELTHLRESGREAGEADERSVDWVTDETAYWNRYRAQHNPPPYRPEAGLRGRSRERNLLRWIRSESLVPAPVVLDMGAGASLTMAGLWPPGRSGVRYVATDLAIQGLRDGRSNLGSAAASVQCDAGSWPFRPGSADVVLVLGVLHHLPDWRAALRRAIDTLVPGGFILLHEVIEKPRIFGRWRRHGVCDAWSSPHEGSVSGQDLRSVLETADGEIMRWREEASPLRFALVHYLDLHVRLERSPRLTAALDVVDQAFGRTAGRIRPSLGFAEVTAVWRRGGAGQPASARAAESSTSRP
jgi:SAM-dependent methyltransferase/uncharacterized protein YbaR (Trm112 family)